MPSPIGLGVAIFLYALRGSRHDVLSSDLFGEPAWDMLLDLYVSAGQGRKLSVSALCIGSRCAQATALRYLGLLEEYGLAERRPDVSDARRSFVALTTAGLDKMEGLLLSAAARTEAGFLRAGLDHIDRRWPTATGSA